MTRSDRNFSRANCVSTCVICGQLVFDVAPCCKIPEHSLTNTTNFGSSAQDENASKMWVMKKDPNQATHASEGVMSEREIDQNLEQSFPASDPPAWTLGTDPHPDMDQESEGDDRKDD